MSVYLGYLFGFLIYSLIIKKLAERFTHKKLGDLQAIGLAVISGFVPVILNAAMTQKPVPTIGKLAVFAFEFALQGLIFSTLLRDFNGPRLGFKRGFAMAGCVWGIAAAICLIIALSLKLAS